MTINIKLSGRHQICLRNLENGLMVPIRGYEKEVPNLITNAGLDSCFVRSYCNSRVNMAIGTGSTPALVTDTTLQSFYEVSTTRSLTENGITVNFAGKYADHFATHTWVNTSGSAKTVREIGLTWESTSNPTIFSRVVLPYAIEVPNGYELIDKYTFRLGIPAWRTPQSGTVIIGGVPVDCTYMIIGDVTAASDTTLNQNNGSSRPYCYFSSSGDVISPFSGCLLEPSRIGGSNSSGRIGLITNPDVYPALTAATNYTNTDTKSYANASLGSYTLGSFTRTKYYTFLASTLPGNTIYGFATDSYFGGSFICRFASGQVKLANRKWTCGISISLARE